MPSQTFLLLILLANQAHLRWFAVNVLSKYITYVFI